MESADLNSDLLVFSEFIVYLRQRGFAIGIHQYLRLHNLLSKLNYGYALSELKLLLCPILATNKLQQEQFYAAFDNFFGAFQPLLEARSLDGETADSESAYTDKHSTVRWHYMHLMVRVLFVVFLFVLVLMTSSDNRGIRQISQEEDVTSSPISSTAPLSTEFIDVQPVFEAQKYEPAVPAPAPNPSFWQKHGKLVHIIISFLPLVFLLAYEAYRFDHRLLILQRQRKKRPPYLWPLKIDTEIPRIYDPEQLYGAAQVMRRRRVAEFSRVDIEATIAATVKTNGYPSLRYKSDSKPSEYLILIDRVSMRDHQSKLFDELVRAFSNEQVLIERFFYEGDPRICFGEGSVKGTYLSDLQSHCAGHRLIIFGGGDRFVNPLTGELEAWVSMFQAWPERALLTPKPIQQWGLMEIYLADQFILFPATLSSIKALMNQFEVPLVASPLQLKRNEDIVAYDSLDFSVLIQTLRKQLGEDTFQWLCACAVYPELQWDLTLYLGSLPCMPNNLITEEHLLRLIRLPWFRQGSLPDELRYRLILEMDKTLEEAIRAALIELLERNPPGKSLANTYAADSYQLNLVIQRWLYRPNHQRFREVLKSIKSMQESQVYKDQTIVRFLKSRSSSPLYLILPKRLRTLFYRNGIAAFGSLMAMRVAIAGILTAIAWFSIKLPKPLEPIPPAGQRPQVIALCRDILFQIGSTDLDEKSIACLDKIIAKLEESPGAVLVIDGHASSSPTRHYPDNMSLARSRARSVAEYLSNHTFKPINILIRNFGDKCPSTVISPVYRRVEIWMLLEGATLSDIDVLKGCRSDEVEPTIIFSGSYQGSKEERNQSNSQSSPSLIQVRLEADKKLIAVGESLSLTAVTQDDQSGSLTYDWETSAGTLQGNGPNIVFDTSDMGFITQPILVQIRVWVISADGERMSSSITINVVPQKDDHTPFLNNYIAQINRLYTQGQYAAALQLADRGLRVYPSSLELADRKRQIQETIQTLSGGSVLSETQPSATSPDGSQSSESPNFQPATIIRKVTPVYPVAAINQRISGRVTLNIEIDEKGDVISVKSIVGPAVFYKASQEAVMNWKFIPARRGGAVVKDSRVITFNFTPDH